MLINILVLNVLPLCCGKRKNLNLVLINVQTNNLDNNHPLAVPSLCSGELSLFVLNQSSQCNNVRIGNMRKDVGEFTFNKLHSFVMSAHTLVLYCLLPFLEDDNINLIWLQVPTNIPTLKSICFSPHPLEGEES